MPPELHAADRAVLDHLVREGLELLDDGRLDEAATTLAEAEALAPDESMVLAATGQLAWARGQLDDARARLGRAASDPQLGDPHLADAHYALARLAEHAGDHAAQVRHDQQVLRLDTAAHRRAGIGDRRQLALVEQAAQRVLGQLPEQFAARLAEVPVVLEPRPDAAVVAEGFDPRAFGLFEGPEDFGRLSHAIADRPSRIVLFYANLLEAFGDAQALEQQVEITLLHEIGHFFGLDEDQVDALGLG